MEMKLQFQIKIVFSKVNCSSNLTKEAKGSRERVRKENPDILNKCETGWNLLDADFTLYELKIAIAKVKETSPGQDEICYSMIGQLSDVALFKLLKLYMGRGQTSFSMETFNNYSCRKAW